MTESKHIILYIRADVSFALLSIINYIIKSMEPIKLEFYLKGTGQLEDALVRLNGEPYELIRREEDRSLNPPSASTSIKVFMNSLIERLNVSGRERTAETYRSALNSFMRFSAGDVPLGSLTSEMMKDYERYLVNRGATLNTVSFYMRILRSAYHKAVKAGLVVDCNPFGGVYTGVANTAKRALSLEDIRRIKQLPLTDASMRFARDMFMFSFYTHGMSFVDMSYLKRRSISDGWLTYHRHKTRQKIMIRWERCMQEIVDAHPSGHEEYLLPIIKRSNGKERNQYRGKQSEVNRQLGQIGREIGLSSNLTMYVARHSWASIAASMDVPIDVISKGMGHTSEKTTRIYLRSLEWSKIDEVNSLIIERLYNKKM